MHHFDNVGVIKLGQDNHLTLKPIYSFLISGVTKNLLGELLSITVTLAEVHIGISPVANLLLIDVRHRFNL
jgi:hypothetical protein